MALAVSQSIAQGVGSSYSVAVWGTKRTRPVLPADLGKSMLAHDCY